MARRLDRFTTMQQQRREQYFDQPDINFPNMDPGMYVLQVRAIDKFGP